MTPRTTTRRAGLIYLLIGLTAPFHLMYIPRRFISTGDAAATAANILAAERLYRVGIFAGLASAIAFLFLVLVLYDLFRDVDRRQARMMVALVVVAVSLAVANLIPEFAPLVLLSGGDWLATFTRDQLETASYAFLRLRNAGVTLATIFWGLWLFPFGILVIRSGYVPRILGYFLFAPGVAYVASSFTTIVFPEYRPTVSRLALPLLFGELPIMVWLVVKGARVPATR